MAKKELPLIKQQLDHSSIEGENDGSLTKNELAEALTEEIAKKDHTSLKKILNRVHYADLADYINFASHEQKQKIITLLKHKLPPEILLEFKIDILLSVIKILGKKRLSMLLNMLPVEDVVQILEKFKEEDRSKILSNLSVVKRKIITRAFSYPKNCAGLLMERNFVSVKSTQTVEQVLAYLADNQELPPDYDEIFVLDTKGYSIGSIHISKLIKAKHTDKAKSIMTKHIQVIDEFLDQEEVSYIFRHYDLSSVPVVNSSKKMVGVISVDQIVDIVEEEAEEDIMRLGGLNMADLYSAFFKTAIHRFPWLFCNLITACVVSTVIAMFESQISKLAVLAAIMPIVASMGGNAGTQSVTVSVRAIANRDIVASNVWRVVFKETLSCLLNGLALGIIGGIILLFMYQSAKLSTIFGLAVVINFTLAGVWGSMIPIGLNKVGLDPAISSSVFVTFLTDLLGVFIFLSLASMVLV